MEHPGTTWRITRFDDIDSTNRWLAAEARAGRASHGDVAIARHQHAGRGRMDRSWVAPPDSALLMSALVRPSGAAERLERWHLVSLAMALAIADTVARLADTVAGLGGRRAAVVPVRLKWPNDVIVPDRGDRKLAGILAEAVPPHGVVVGAGTNRMRPPSVDGVLAERAIWLSDIVGDSAAVPEADALAALVLTRFGARLQELADDPAGLLGAYTASCATIGRRVRVELGGATLEGVAVAVTAEGHLRVQSDMGGTHDVTVGDVVHVRSAAV